MSRFKSDSIPPRVPAPQQFAPVATVPPPPSPVREKHPSTSAVAVDLPHPPGGGAKPEIRLSIAHNIGLGALCLYLLSYSGFLNESLLTIVGTKPYISLISGPVAALALFASGSLFRGLRTKIGVLWTCMLMLMLAGVPFSVWKSDSLREWLNYASRVYPIFFFICAAAFTVAHCRKLFYANILGGFFVLALTVAFSTTSASRLILPEGSFSNPNALALQLLLSACFFAYLVYRGNFGLRLAGLAGVATALILIFETGSRGAFAAVFVSAIALCFVVKRMSTRLKLLLVFLLLGFCGFLAALANPAAVRRLTDVSWASEGPSAQQGDDLYARSSQLARQQLLALSVDYTLSHPLLGVGMGEFSVAVDGDAKKVGRRSSWAGTHNSYTQVSAECGIPAALCYIGVILLCIQSNWKLFRETNDSPLGEDSAAMALSLFLALTSLAVTTFFYHIAYGYYVPTLAGLSVALRLASIKTAGTGARQWA